MKKEKCLKEIAIKYFEDNPNEKNGVVKAYYAYHSNHFRLEPEGHNFPGSMRTSKCEWCGRSREQVRWDNLPPTCLARPINLPDIEETIKNEEYNAFKLFERAETFIPKYLSNHELNGESLAILHHTYGYDIDIVGNFIEIDDKLISEYEKIMDIERSKSKDSKI